MENEAPGKEAKAGQNAVFRRVSENLYRLETSGGYYALVKRGGKQFRRSLKTKDRKLAERRLSEFQDQVGNLTTSDEAKLSFNEIADRWMANTSHALKPATVARRKLYLKSLSPFFAGTAIRNIQPQHCERWLEKRAPKIAPLTMGYELATMKALFEFAVNRGLMLKNPARDIKRAKATQCAITIPSREQFKTLVAAIRQSDGRLESQKRAAAGADLVELLAFSGCRLNEAISLTWADIDFERGSFTVTGGVRGTKNHERRYVPLTPALRALLLRLSSLRQHEASDKIIQIGSAKKCLGTACRRLSYPTFSHHDFRHLFATTCIESGVDIPTISRWLGHKDGGALAMRVYGHLRNDHSLTAAEKVSFH